ncbi:MAG: hypothetical protein ACI4DY_09005 [Monoglobaceae bacterium]
MDEYIKRRRKTCKFDAPCLCHCCEANDGKRCTIRKEPTCMACSSKQYECITHCTEKIRLDANK